MKLNLLVLRTTRLEDMRSFYSALGAQFQIEKHGNGPEHYAATIDDDLVLELYPTPDGAMPDAGLRLGLKVENISETLRLIGQDVAPRQTQWGLRAIIRDPDGRTVELVQSVAESNTDDPVELLGVPGPLVINQKRRARAIAELAAADDEMYGVED